ncbi:MAG: topoisomerase DNA-binding C4 zinc finger domain-containing protein [Peptococcaceae bacterium]|nr:topoisomerase DNA-binding C4 zinc finger domain-containing protein [Peptococcaceae bacterium]
MVARSGRKGRFYGCSGYPACQMPTVCRVMWEKK